MRAAGENACCARARGVRVIRSLYASRLSTRVDTPLSHVERQRVCCHATRGGDARCSLLLTTAYVCVLLHGVSLLFTARYERDDDDYILRLIETEPLIEEDEGASAW